MVLDANVTYLLKNIEGFLIAFFQQEMFNV